MRSIFIKPLICLFTALLLSVFSLGVSAAEDEALVVTSAEELEDALSAGGAVRLGCDVTVSTMITVPEGVGASLDLFGNTLSTASEANTFVINNLGRLTVTDTVGGGEVNSRGIYNGYDADGYYVTDAELQIDGGIFNARGTNGGAAVFNYGRVTLNGGRFTATGAYSLNNRSGASMLINLATVEAGVYNMGELTVNGGELSNSRAAAQTVSNTGKLVISGGSFTSHVKTATVSSSSRTYAVIKGGSFANSTGYYVMDGYFDISGGELCGAVRSKGLSVSGGIFNNGSASVHSISKLTVSGGVFVDAGSAEVARAALAEGYAFIKNPDGSYEALDCDTMVLRDAKYNLTTTASFVGNLYVRSPREDAGYRIDTDKSTGYVGSTVIDGAEYLVFSARPSTDTVTGNIEFSLSASYEGRDITVSASFTTAGYFAAAMKYYFSSGAPSEADAESMTLIMNATHYANELYKYATDNGDFAAYAELLENEDYGKYLTSVSKEELGEDVPSDSEPLAAVFKYATLEIKTGYGASYLFGVLDGYDVSRVTRVTISYDKIGESGIERAHSELAYDPERNAYVASEMPIYDMTARLTVTVSFSDGAEDVVGAYDLATYVRGSDSAIGYAIWAYAQAAYEYKVVRISEK